MKQNLAHARHWPTWCVVGIAWLICRLPIAAQFKIGRFAGAVFHAVGARRRKIAEVNIATCFPELDAQTRRALVKESFASLGISLLETAYAWLRPVDALVGRVTIHGIRHFEAAVAQGRGVLLLGGHFSVIDLGGAAFAAGHDIDAMYRASKNPVIDHIALQGRRRHFKNVVESRDVRTTIRLLRQNRVIWYAADQDYGRRHSVFAPFFGVEAATITATSRLARANQSPVVFASIFRDQPSRTWTIRFTPVNDFPSGDDRTDATTLNGIIETEIRRHPEQYLWVHRRFKTRPDPHDYPYGERRRKHSRKRRAKASVEKRSATR